MDSGTQIPELSVSAGDGENGSANGRRSAASNGAVESPVTNGAPPAATPAPASRLVWSVSRTDSPGRRTLVVGAGGGGHEIARQLGDRPGIGLHPVGIFDCSPHTGNGNGLPVARRARNGADNPENLVASFGGAVTKLRVERVVFSFGLQSRELQLALIRECRERGVDAYLAVPGVAEAEPDQIHTPQGDAPPPAAIVPVELRNRRLAAKYALDRVLAVLGLTLVAPLLLAIGLGIFLTLGRPIIFRQPRTGVAGTQFGMFKFRTMRGAPDDGGAPDPAAIDEAVLGVGGIPLGRRTRFGAAIRRFGLDELPQLVNLVRGEMSLVGPRPELVGFAPAYANAIERYQDRLRVRPGITGWAQVHGLRGESSIHDRVAWDNRYIDTWSPGRDLEILLRTIISVFRDRIE